MSTPAFTIYVQRKNQQGDDVIRISRSNLDSSRFRLTYEDETSHMNRPREMYLTEMEVMEYMGTLINGLFLDRDPFDHFQIMPPAAPSIQFDIADLKEVAVQQAIYASLQFAMRHWIVQEVPPLVVRDGPHRRAVLNPEDTESEDEAMRTPPRRSTRRRATQN